MGTAVDLGEEQIGNSTSLPGTDCDGDDPTALLRSSCRSGVVLLLEFWSLIGLFELLVQAVGGVFWNGVSDMAVGGVFWNGVSNMVVGGVFWNGVSLTKAGGLID